MLGQLWQLPPDGAGAALTWAAKLENCFWVFLDPQCSQAGFLAAADATSTSVVLPQSWHLYSNIGIFLLLMIFYGSDPDSTAGCDRAYPVWPTASRGGQGDLRDLLNRKDWLNKTHPPSE